MNSELAQINDINLKIFDEICAERFRALDLECVLISLIDKVPIDALPHLAEQYHVTGNEGWLQAVTEEEKRNLIKSSIKMHRYKGTKYALKEIFRTLNLTGDIEEWFNYGGQPYHFKVLLQISDTSISENTKERLLASVKEYKNERSWLEALNFLLISKGKTHIYSALAEEQTITVNKKA